MSTQGNALTNIIPGYILSQSERAVLSTPTTFRHVAAVLVSHYECGQSMTFGVAWTVKILYIKM